MPAPPKLFNDNLCLPCSILQSKLGYVSGIPSQSKVLDRLNDLKMQNIPFSIGYSTNLRFAQNELFDTAFALKVHPVFIAL